MYIKTLYALPSVNLKFMSQNFVWSFFPRHTEGKQYSMSDLNKVRDEIDCLKLLRIGDTA